MSGQSARYAFSGGFAGIVRLVVDVRMIFEALQMRNDLGRHTQFRR
jgi:hypothetical protein